MGQAVLDDYFSFMLDKSDGKRVPQDRRTVGQPVKAAVRPDVADRVPQSQMEVTESPLSDTEIERIFRRPNP